MFTQSSLQSIYRLKIELRSLKEGGEGGGGGFQHLEVVAENERPLSFSLMYLLGKMVKLALRIFLLCWLLFSSNSSASTHNPLVNHKHLLMSDPMLYGTNPKILNRSTVLWRRWSSRMILAQLENLGGLVIGRTNC